MAMPREQHEAQARAYSRVVARAWADPAFRERLLAQPAVVLREHGIPVPDGKQVQMHEASDATAHFVLPSKPAGLSDEQLSQVAGGFDSAGCYCLSGGW